MTLETLKQVARKTIVVCLIIMTLLLALSIYTGTSPPFVVVDGRSMQHTDQSAIGVIDAGDIVLLQANARITTYVEGRSIGYLTYGDYGDVLVFKHPVFGLVIHRAIMYVRLNGTGYDVPGLKVFNVTEVRIDGMGWKRDLSITFQLDKLGNELGNEEGYITMGDRNAYGGGYDLWIVKSEYVLGRARGEIPYMGLVPLVARGQLVWGDGSVPSNSWLGLNVTLSIVVTSILVTILFGSLKNRRERWLGK